MHRPSSSNVPSVSRDNLLLKTPKPLFCIGFGSADGFDVAMKNRDKIDTILCMLIDTRITQRPHQTHHRQQHFH